MLKLVIRKVCVIILLSLCFSAWTQEEELWKTYKTVNREGYSLEFRKKSKIYEPIIDQREHEELLKKFIVGEIADYPYSTPYAEESYELIQVKKDGEELKIWSTTGSATVAQMEGELYKIFQVVEIWDLSEQNTLILCNKGRDLILLMLREADVNHTILVDEVELNSMGGYPATDGIVYTMQEGDILEISAKAVDGCFISQRLYSNEKLVVVDEQSISGHLANEPSLQWFQWRNYNKLMDASSNSTKKAEKAFEELLQIELSQSLTFLQKWSTKLNEQEKAKFFVKIISQLLRTERYGKTEQISLQNSSGWTEDEKKCLIIGTALYTRIEYDMNPPDLNGDYDLRKVERLLCHYLYDFVLPRVEERVRGLEKEELIELAKYPIPHICPSEAKLLLYVLSRNFSDDMGPEIRKAVINNPWTEPFDILVMIRHETEPSVRAELEAFCKDVHAFPPENERLLPPGW